MINRVKIDLNQAIEFSIAGFSIECFVLMDKKLNTKTGRKLKRRMSPNTKLTFSVEGVEPLGGEARTAWLALKKLLWSRSITKVYTRKEVRDAYIKVRDGDKADTSTRLSYLIYQCKVIRIVEEG